MKAAAAGAPLFFQRRRQWRRGSSEQAKTSSKLRRTTTTVSQRTWLPIHPCTVARARVYSVQLGVTSSRCTDVQACRLPRDSDGRAAVFGHATPGCVSRRKFLAPKWRRKPSETIWVWNNFVYKNRSLAPGLWTYCAWIWNSELRQRWFKSVQIKRRLRSGRIWKLIITEAWDFARFLKSRKNAHWAFKSVNTWLEKRGFNSGNNDLYKLILDSRTASLLNDSDKLLLLASSVVT